MLEMKKTSHNKSQEDYIASLEAAIEEAHKEIAEGKGIVESVEEHIKRLRKMNIESDLKNKDIC